MSWRTNSFVISLRNIGRTLGLNRPLALLFGGRGYESNYDDEFRNRLRAGDCVWDIGANVGYYTAMFAEKVGTNGKVCAFEPSPTNYRKLQSRCQALPNVSLFPFALGDSDGELMLQQGTDDLGATSRVGTNGSEGEKVAVRTGDGLVKRGEAPQPTALKVDVEGFEVEVFKGLPTALSNKSLHVVGIEVHFGILKERGLGGAPRQLEAMMKSAGFQVRWPDNSHIVGIRTQ